MADLPSWYRPETPPTSATPNAPLPSWYKPEPAAVAAADPSQGVVSQANDLGANVITGLLRIPGAVGGIPHLVGHTANWGQAQVYNALDKVLGGPGGHTGAELDARDPVMRALPSSQDIDKVVEKPAFVPEIMNRPVYKDGEFFPAGKEAEFYKPESFIGRLLQAGVTAAGAGGGSLPNAIKTGLAGMAAESANEFFPNQPALSALAALLTHAGAGAGTAAAVKGYRTFAEPLVKPVNAGEAMAGDKLAPADHTQPGLADPSRRLIDLTADTTRKAVDDIGPGVDDYTAGGSIRTALQGRKDALTTARGEAADQAFGEFRSQPPMPGTELAPFMQSPTFRSAIRAAGNSVLDGGEKPLTDYFAFLPENAGEPTIVPDAAIPPDVLARVREKLGDALNKAEGSDKNSVGKLVANFDAAMNARYPQTFAPTRTDFAKASAPINEMETGPVGKVLDSDTRYGRRTYAMPQDKVAGTFLKSGALRSDFDALVKGYGGDKTAALKALEGNLADKVQGAIQGDGTLSLDSFNRSVRPYTKALNMWFPELSQKFSTAEAAQKTLNRLTSQREIATDIKTGELRGDDGFITGSSLSKWLDRNEKRLSETQSKGALLRLRQIAQALPETPGAGPEAAVEAAPMVVGTAAAGLEGGVLGGITHKLPAYLAGPRLAEFRKAYSEAIERAVVDPVAAQQLVALAAKRGGKQSLAQVLRDTAKKAALATPIATAAGTGAH